MSGLGTCRDCGEWIYWGQATRDDGTTRNIPYDEPSHETLHWATCPAQEYITYLGSTQRVTKCTKCQHRVFWTVTRNGKKRPMDCYADEDEYGNVTWVADGECHFDTCVGPRTRPSTERTREYSHTTSQTNGKAHVTSSPNTGADYRVRLFLPDLKLTWPCTRADVQSAFRKQALMHHPDMGGQAAEFIRVKRAYDALSKLVPA